MNTKINEKEFLESVIKTYVTSESSQDRLIKSLAVRTFKPFISKNASALELGCCDGYMTSLILPLVENLTVVDGSTTFIEMAKSKLSKDVEFVHALFEEYHPQKKFDYIFATYVLEHVSDPVSFLRHVSSLLNEQGLLFIVVPNATALSRQLARHMGIIDDLFALTENDKHHGHRRVYDRVLFNRDITAAGLHQVSQGGLLLKLLSDFQMEKMIDTNILGESQMEGLYKMGMEYPELSGSLFSVCKAIQ